MRQQIHANPATLEFMDVERFEKSPIGQLVPITVSDVRFDEEMHHYAYVPSPLPNSIPLVEATWNTVAEASAAVGRLDAATARLPNPMLLVRPAIRKEAISTSALEGTYAELLDVLEAELLEDQVSSTEVREVRNYVRAAETAYELIRERPIATNMVADLQLDLVRGTRGDSYQAGKVRERQVWIGPKDTPVTESNFVPPPPGKVLLDGLADWEQWIHRDDDIALLVRVAIGHYQFETLHPFHDGNGRLGRLIAILQLMERGMLRHPVLYISPYLEARRDQYVDLLRHVSATGDFDPWVSFFAEAVRVQSDDSVARTETLLTLGDEMVGTLRGRRVRGVALQIAEGLIGYPVITPTQAAINHDCSYQAANNAIARLVKEGILEELTGRSYGRAFASRAILRAIR